MISIGSGGDAMPARGGTIGQLVTPPGDQVGNTALLAFIVCTLLVTMSVTQQFVVEAGSIVYWLLLVPSIAFPLFNLRAVLKTSLSWPSLLLVAMLLLAGTWHLLVGDARSILRLYLMTVVLIWISSDSARLRISDVVRFYLFTILVGVFVYLLFDINKWGPIPAITAPEFGQWRVSFFPNIAYTASLSLFVLMVLCLDVRVLRKYAIVVAIALYFIITSFVRTALIGLVLFVVMRFLLGRVKSRLAMFLVAGLSAVGINVAIALSPAIVVLVQDWPFVSRLFLHGRTGLDLHDVFVNLYRPWIWAQHFEIFLQSPYLMGWGNFDFHALKTENLRGALEWSDTVSMPSRLLASHGLPALLFAGFVFAQLAARARERDLWACACFTPLVLFLMQWGSLFHPSDPMFLLFFLLLTRGAKGFLAADGGGGQGIAWHQQSQSSP